MRQDEPTIITQRNSHKSIDKHYNQKEEQELPGKPPAHRLPVQRLQCTSQPSSQIREEQHAHSHRADSHIHIRQSSSYSRILLRLHLPFFINRGVLPLLLCTDLHVLFSPGGLSLLPNIFRAKKSSTLERVYHKQKRNKEKEDCSSPL